MNQVLTPDECRVLGALIEKAQTTPAQYPLTLNALTNAVNQKSNRSPVVSLNEDRVMAALDGLRVKGLVREVTLSGSRVEKYRHVARDILQVTTSELVVLAELLLRGPQTLGEIRGNASRMHPLESLEVTRNVIDSMLSKGEPTGPLIRELAAGPGSRSVRYAQTLCQDLHPIDEARDASSSHESSGHTVGSDLHTRIDHLEAEVARLTDIVDQLVSQLRPIGSKPANP